MIENARNIIVGVCRKKAVKVQLFEVYIKFTGV